MRRAARVNENQEVIVEALRALGYSVVHLHQLGHGVPDLLVGLPGLTIVGEIPPLVMSILESCLPGQLHNGANLLVEVKMLGKNLTDDEAEFFEEYLGQCTMVFSVEEALGLIGR